MTETTESAAPHAITKGTAVSIGLVVVLISAAFLFHTWIDGRLDGLMGEVQKNGSRLERLEERTERSGKSEEAMWKRLTEHAASDGHPVTRQRTNALERRVDKLEAPK